MIGTIRSSTNLKASIEADHRSFTENVATANTILLARKSRCAVRRVVEKRTGDNDTAKTVGGKTSMLVGLIHVNEAR
jgi:hypothetical protein